MRHSYYKRVCAFLFGILLTSQLAMAQYQVTGLVTDDATGDILVGVTVFDPSTGNGTTTNLDGRYTIDIPSGDATLRFSYIGYLTQNINVSGSNGATVTMDVAMKSDVANLDELVVTGLASTVKRSNLANSVASINAEDIAGNNDPSTIDNALYGKIPGVNIISQGGAPGGGFNIQLRGVSTLGAGTSQPLYIIDGVYVNNSAISTGRSSVSGAGGSSQDDVANRLADLNPDDIASIEVLKGSSAAAIYGQRANAGVIIITTKKGKTGETEVSVQQDIGFTNAVRLLGRTEWNEAKIRTFWGTGARGDLEVQRYNDASNAGRIRDLEKEIYGETGLLKNTQLSVSAGGAKTRYFLSGNLKEEDGIIKNSGFERQSVRANVEHNISDRVIVTSNTNFVRSVTDRSFTGNQNATGGSLGYTLAFTPNYAYNLLVNPDGTYNNNPYFSENPFRLRDKAENTQAVSRVVQSFGATADLAEWGASRLALRANGGFDIINSNSMVYFPEFMQSQSTLTDPGDVIHTTTDIIQTNLQASLVYNTTLVSGENEFFLTSQAGYSRFRVDQEVETLRGQGLAPGQVNVQNANVQLLGQAFQEVTDVGYFAQQEINWADKAILTIGGRMDKSTLNVQQDELYFYPKASVAFNLTNFDFWNYDEFNQLKLRAAYGETGGLASFGQTFSPLNSVNIGGNLGGVQGTRAIDPELVPERAKEIEFGIDLSVLDQKVSFEATYYNKTVEDLILDLVPSNSTGITAVATNAAELENKGLELGLNVNLVRNVDIDWMTRIFWWTNSSEITKLNIPDQYNTAFGAPVLGGVLLREGESPTAIGGQNADGDLVKFGDFQPDFQMSIGNEFKLYKNWSLDFLFHFSQGAENIQLSNLLRDSGGNTDDYFVSDTETVDRGPFITSQFVQDASYIKLREASLYYTVPKASLTGLFGDSVRGIKLGVSGNNLLLISDYDGYDPEVSNFGRQSVLSSVSVTPYPSARRVLFHVKLDL